MEVNEIVKMIISKAITEHREMTAKIKSIHK